MALNVCAGGGACLSWPSCKSTLSQSLCFKLLTASSCVSATSTPKETMSDICFPDSLLSFFQSRMSKYYYGTSRMITEQQNALFLGRGYFVRQPDVSPKFTVCLILSACGLSNLTKTYSSWSLLWILWLGLCLCTELYFTSEKHKS